MGLSFLSVGSGWRSLVQQLIAAGVVTCRVRVQERGPQWQGPAQLVEPQICIVIGFHSKVWTEQYLDHLVFRWIKQTMCEFTTQGS